ncbi:MAG: DUF1911 domain-containing protein [Candidatus Parvibacillus calidus]|nr:DUF1911 domain-containing protein [Vicingus serpentipes]QLH28331.1 MAG: DUF1911 domain-containing protein [Candidatus Parvibacillus calidus]
MRQSFYQRQCLCVATTLNIDDSSFRDNPYYPKDLVDYYRKNHPDTKN